MRTSEVISEARIFLADQRGCSQADWYRSYQTFALKNNLNPEKEPFGNLIGVNDDTLKGNCTLTFEISESVEILLLPVVGSIEYVSNSGLFDCLDAGESNLIFLEEGDELRITNPFEVDLINFVHIWRSRKHDHQSDTIKAEIDLDESKNQFSMLASSNQYKSVIGKFEGRAEGTFKISSTTKGVFILVLEGAFEVQNRLLETRDGLALWNVAEVELEALSNDAIILLLEVDC